MTEENHKEFIEKFYKTIMAKIIKDFHSHIEDNGPELLINFNELYIETTRMIQIMQKDFDNLSRKMKKIIDSKSLYEDVYKMRDDLIEIKRIVDRVSKKEE